jgi:p-cumate 2,3-dioxygenase alpha subunit
MKQMDVQRLVRDQPAAGLFRVHRSAMTSPEVLELEWERLFARCWLYVAHDSELPEAGDYRRRTVAGRPLFVVRGRDGQIRVFHNTCSHRGALVCRRDEGRADQFQCFYHAWTYNSHGELIGVPDEGGYAAAFDRAELGLQSPPRVESYRGLYFVSFDPDAMDLATYLGDARELIDQTMDCAEPLGGWAVIAGTARYSIHANWKLLVENSIDNYHLATVHQTYFEYMAQRRAAAGVDQLSRPEQRARSRGLALSGRHSAMLLPTPGRTIAYPSPLWSDEANREIGRVRDLLIARYGDARGHQMAELSRFVIIFPNLIFQDTLSGFRLRQIWPTAPDHMDVVQWELVPREERADLRAYRMEFSLTFLGPGGFGTPDDVEALESCQTGFRSGGVEWSDISRGMHREPLDDDEMQMRTFWRQWHALLQGQAQAPLVDERACAAAAQGRTT